MSKLAQLRSAALPFVTRAHRGGRLRRYLFLSLLLSILTLILGAWISFGSGHFESAVRQGLNLEESRWQREQFEHLIIVDSAQEEAIVLAEIQAFHPASEEWNQARSKYDEAVNLLRQAAIQESPRGQLRTLQAEVQMTLAQHGISHEVPDPDVYYTYFNWHEAQQVQQLQAILARDLVPAVEIYESPLTLVDGVRVTGAIAGGIFALLLLVAAPLLVGTQMAQEVHENTLMPLTGTSLRTRELVLGLGAGALSIVGLLALPQALLLLLTVAFVGHLIPALAGIAVALVGCFFLSFLAQLIGYALGSQRTPGVLGIGLLSFFGTLAMIGAAFGLNPAKQTIGVYALLPEAATAHLFRSSLLPHEIFFRDWRLAHEADFAIAVGTVGIGLLGLLGLRALERKISRKAVSALTGGEALLGALVTMVLVVLANPARQNHYGQSGTFFLLNLVLLTVPFVIFLMMRTPSADLGEKRKALPVAALLGELFLWAGLLGVLSLAVLKRPLDASIHPVFIAYFAWYLGVVGLLAIRVVAMPMSLASRAWIAFSALFAMSAFPQMAAWVQYYGGTEDLLMMSQMSPFLGFVQAALLVAIPVTLWRSLRRRP